MNVQRASGQRVRLFVALELPTDIRAALTAWAQAQLRSLLADLRLIPPEFLHVTLCFLGSRPAEEVPAIVGACGSAVGAPPAGVGPEVPAGVGPEVPAGSRLPAPLTSLPAAGAAPAIALALGDPVWLPQRRPRVVAVQLSDTTGALRDLQAVLSSALADGGFYEPESRAFLAHVTVARVGHRARVRPAALAPPEPIRFVAPALTLYRSQTGPRGARYQALTSVALGTP